MSIHSSITGTAFIVLRNLSERFQYIQKDVVKQAAISARPKVEEEIYIAFSQETAPTQKKWAPLKPRKFWNKEIPYPAGRPILKGLKEFFHVGLRGEGKISVRNEKWYAKFHFTGTKYMAHRRYLPFLGEKVPAWETNVGAAVIARVDQMIKDRHVSGGV